MEELKVFSNEEFGEVRTTEVDGKILFCGSDVAKALGYTNTRKAISDHCKWVTKRYTPHPQSKDKTLEVSFITESDIYRLIVKSKLPSAEKFETWVFEEVLPSIRKNGGYIANQENLSSEQILANAVLVAQNVIAEKDKLITEMQPKALFADAVSTSHMSILIGDLAKLLKQNRVDIGQKRLFAWMRENGYLIKRQGADYNSPTQKSMELGLLEIKETAITHADGHVSVSKTSKVTGKGQQYFINKFLGKRDIRCATQ